MSDDLYHEDDALFNTEVVKDLCKDENEVVQTKIKAAYWTGCYDGMAMMREMKSSKNKIDLVEDNIVYLKDLKDS